MGIVSLVDGSDLYGRSEKRRAKDTYPKFAMTRDNAAILWVQGLIRNVDELSDVKLFKWRRLSNGTGQVVPPFLGKTAHGHLHFAKSHPLKCSFWKRTINVFL